MKTVYFSERLASTDECTWRQNSKKKISHHTGTLYNDDDDDIRMSVSLLYISTSHILRLRRNCAQLASYYVSLYGFMDYVLILNLTVPLRRIKHVRNIECLSGEDTANCNTVCLSVCLSMTKEKTLSSFPPRPSSFLPLRSSP